MSLNKFDPVRTAVWLTLLSLIAIVAGYGLGLVVMALLEAV